MKTRQESDAIDIALKALEIAYAISGYRLRLLYDNQAEVVCIQNDKEMVRCNVAADSVATVINDVVKTVQQEIVL